MKIRPGAVAETLLALACGAALSYAADVDPNPRPFNFETMPWRVAYLLEPFLTGVALVGGLGLLIESAVRRRPVPPSPWGLGRWTWALVGLYLWLRGLIASGQFAALAALRKIPKPSASLLLGNLLFVWRFVFTREILYIMIAFMIAARLARLPRDSEPDARERAGRGFLGIALAWAIGFQAMIWAGA